MFWIEKGANSSLWQEPKKETGDISFGHAVRKKPKR